MGAPTPDGASQLPNASVEQSHLANLDIGPKLPPEPSPACGSVHWNYQKRPQT